MNRWRLPIALGALVYATGIALLVLAERRVIVGCGFYSVMFFPVAVFWSGNSNGFATGMDVPFLLALNFAFWPCACRFAIWAAESLPLPKSISLGWKSTVATAAGVATLVVLLIVARYRDRARFANYAKIPIGASSSDVLLILGLSHSSDGNRAWYEGNSGTIDIEFDSEGRVVKKGYMMR